MDIRDVIFDLINNYLWGDDGHSKELTEFEMGALSIKICKELGICEKCGAKLKGEDNVQ